MRPLCLILIFATCIAAHAQTFEDRVRFAKEIEASDLYKAYQRVMYQRVGQHLANTMKTCFETIANPRADAFTLIADVTSTGRLRAIEVRPDTNIAKCFTEGVVAAAFPPPPAIPARDAFPIVIDMKMKP